MNKIIIDSIKEVERQLGNHYKENIYQNALFIELNKKNLTCQTEVIVPIYYDNIQIGFERADILVY